jgi:hypothetical protein
MPDRDGRPLTDDSFYVALNAGTRDRRFRLPPERLGERWRTVLDTAARPEFPRLGRLYRAGWRFRVAAHAVVVLQRADG